VLWLQSVVLVTHQLQYLKFADTILVLNKQGQQIFCDNYAALLKVLPPLVILM